MKTRFEGVAGQRLLLETIKRNKLVQGDGTLAQKLMDKATLVEFRKGDKLITQGSIDNHALFILAGTVQVLVNNRPVAVRGPGDVLGEMALIDPAAPRSATVVASDALAALQVDEPSFAHVREEHPVLWKHVALILGDKLRERSKFIRAPNKEPKLFIGCSVEGLPLAREIESGLKHDSIAVRLWTNGVFTPSSITIEAILKETSECDFGAVVFGPDDSVASRGTSSSAPRDNVVFEIGIFMGALGRERAFVIRDVETDLKIPSDLLGVTPITYARGSGRDLASIAGPVCTDLRKTIEALGVR